jgi:hypothetical protein
MILRFFLLLTMAVLLTPAAQAQGVNLGIGPFGGFNIPIAQEDQGTGNAYGLRARIKLFSFLVAEPNVTFAKWGEPDPIRGIDLGIDGSEVTSYGIDATLGGLPGKPGFKPFFVVGAGIYDIKNDDTDYDESKMGFSAGLGFIFGASPKFDIDVRGSVIVAPQEEGSKKAAIITGGLTYYFSFGH